VGPPEEGKGIFNEFRRKNGKTFGEAGRKKECTKGVHSFLFGVKSKVRGGGQGIKKTLCA